MAQVIDGINGLVKGKAGNSVFYTMYGKNFVRSCPDVVKRQKPSSKQLRQRQRMALVQSLLQPCKELVKLTFASVTKANAPYHVAKSYNLRHAIKGDAYPEQELDWEHVYLSAGSVELPDKCEVQKQEGGLCLNWSQHKGEYTDTLLVIALDTELSRIEYRFTGEPRHKKSYMWDVDLAGHQWHIWVVFRSSDEKDISNSMYLGLV